MKQEEVSKSIGENVIEQIVKYAIPLLLGGIGTLLVIGVPEIRNLLIQHPDIFLALLAIMIFIIILLLFAYIRIHRQYARFHESYGVLWDNNFNARCLSCKKPLKYSSTDVHILYCSDPKCNSKHILRDSTGNPLSRQEAIDSIRADKETH